MAKTRSLVEINYIFLFFLFIIILFLGVLYFLLALPRCSMEQPFMCFGHKVEGDTTKVIIKNNLGYNMYIKSVNLEGCTQPGSGLISGNDFDEFTMSGCNFKFFYKNGFIIEYVLIGDSGISHTQTGFISGAKGINL